jgi:hypothetical protein
MNEQLERANLLIESIENISFGYDLLYENEVLQYLHFARCIKSLLRGFMQTISTHQDIDDSIDFRQFLETYKNAKISFSSNPHNIKWSTWFTSNTGGDHLYEKK